MDRAITAEDQRRRYSRMILETFLNAYFNAAAFEAIDYLGRHVWVKQRGCDHEEEEEREEDSWTAATLGCDDSRHAHR